jgi:hypothetical protein
VSEPDRSFSSPCRMSGLHAMRSIRQNMQALKWLSGGDPSIRWQALRDLADASPESVTSERERVVSEGWGKRLLERQDPDGTWAGGLYTPKWTSTTYTMLLLRDMGLPHTNQQAAIACALMLERGFCHDEGIGFGWSSSETCVTGMVLAILAYFRLNDDRLDRIAEHLLERQMTDGGWNCRLPFGAVHASVHTTISVLEGLADYERFRGRHLRKLKAAQQRGREFLLAHRLFRSHRSGKVIKPAFVRLAFPPRWHYDLLRALDYFRAVDAPADERLADAITVLEAKQLPDGRWKLDHSFPGREFFALERVGRASRWNTLRALRVLRWWGK